MKKAVPQTKAGSKKADIIICLIQVLPVIYKSFNNIENKYNYVIYCNRIELIGSK